MRDHALQQPRLPHDRKHDDGSVEHEHGRRNDDHGKVSTDPNAVVDGQTITQWSEDWIRTLLHTPAGDVNGLNDPEGTVAKAVNSSQSSMYFITAAPPGSVRTFEVSEDQDVLVPIVGRTDAEGPDIAPSVPDFVPARGSYADEVRFVLDNTTFLDVTLTVDGRAVPNLQLTSTGIFSVGVVEAGTAAVDFFGAKPGASLSTTGQIGYFAVLHDLHEGTHTVTTTSRTSSFGQVSSLQQYTDIIKVG